MVSERSSNPTFLECNGVKFTRWKIERAFSTYYRYTSERVNPFDLLSSIAVESTSLDSEDDLLVQMSDTYKYEVKKTQDDGCFRVTIEYEGDEEAVVFYADYNFKIRGMRKDGLRPNRVIVSVMMKNYDPLNVAKMDLFKEFFYKDLLPSMHHKSEYIIDPILKEFGIKGR